ncbi:MAG TPA: DUF59 domain-containing protein [Acidobacteriaceae bacterium]
MATQPAALTEAAIHLALRDCYHPELSLDLVDLGAVENISLTPDDTAPGTGISGVPQRYRVCIRLAPPPAADEATNSQIAAIIRNRLAAFEAVSATEVLLLDEPRWTPDRVSPEARTQIAARNASTKHGLVQIQK